MRPAAQQQQRTPATNFVQEYAAKRQLQMELAKKIREDRLHQQGTRELGSGGVSMGTKGKENLAAPPMTSGADKVAEEKFASRSVVLQVAEEDFKEATKAGIITPDQARQLWAMLSNQLIRVAPSSRESMNTGCFSATVASLLALSSTPTSPSEMDSSQNKGNFWNSTKKNSHGGDKHSEGKFAFGGSISLESLRQSIAYFKEQQEQMRQEQYASKSKQHSRAEETNLRHHPAHHYYGDEENTLDARYGKLQSPPIHEDEEEEEMNIRGAYDKAAPVVKSKVALNNHNTKKKPEWNSDVNVDGLDGREGGVNDRSPRAAAATTTAATLSKSLAARVAAQKTGSSAKSQPSRGNKTNRQQQQQFPPQPSYSSYGNPPSQQSNEELESRQDDSAVCGRVGNKPETPLNLDDVPILPKGNNSSYNLKAVLAAPAQKRKEAGRVAALNSNSNINNFDIALNELADANDRIAAEALAAAQEPTRECGICGRTFRVSILSKHEPLCRKTSKKPKKVFNMQAHRLEGVEGMDQIRLSAPANNNHNTHRSNHAAASLNAKKIPKWRIQHEQFQAAMRAVHQQKGTEHHEGGGGVHGYGGGMPQSLPPEFDDRVPCPHCGRKFAEEVAERHIPKCANTVAKPRGIRPIRR